ncbi:hypothetical protein TUBRATIS_10390 [Tubulinosema ratisbonensis]|uniref:Uncharacterized protein n=1 Tax=Tubulinosema ratisbonensis TaxID=291195 RepID=A0A437AML2_9MICR|nr:hypothetical protein TUBRATIS_10390 [Tubulinosema ratisbonensis]
MLTLIAFVYSISIYIPSKSQYLWIGMSQEPHGGPYFIASDMNLSKNPNYPVDLIFTDKKTKRTLCIEKNSTLLVASTNCSQSNYLFRAVRHLSGKFFLMQNEKCLQFFERQNAFYLRTCASNPDQLFEFLNKTPEYFSRQEFDSEE